MVLGAVLGHEAHHRPRVLDVAVRPLVLRAHEEHVEAQAVRRDQAALDHLGDVALAAPYRELARPDRPVRRGHASDAQADHRERRGVREVAGEGLAPDLAAAVEPVGARGRLVGEDGPLRHLVVAARDQRRVGLLPLPVAHGGPTARVDHAPHPRAAGRLEDVVGAHHVVPHDRIDRRIRLHVRGQMHHRVHAVERGSDRGEIADVGLVALHARDRPAVQRAQGEAPLEPAAHRGPDEAAHPGDQDPTHGPDHIMWADHGGTSPVRAAP